MRLGIIPADRTPASASGEYVRGVARVVEEEGGESIWFVEHVVVPAEYASAYPYGPGGGRGMGDSAFPDPLALIAFAAASTRTLLLGTGVVILPEHHPVEYAKRLATLDALSGGRIRLGVGVGWIREEAEALGLDFAERGARTDEGIDVMRALWRTEVASFRGRFFRFERVRMRPKPARLEGVPILIGGRSAAAARRAGRRGDGFYPLDVTPETLPRLLDVMRAEAVAAGRDAAAIELMAEGPPDLDTAKRLRDLGVTRLTLRAPPEGGLDALRRRIADYRARVLDRLT
jgi:probable F420-dependent oxidoreductase